MTALVRVSAAVLGVVIALGTLRSAIRTVVLPRSEVVSLTGAVFLGLRKLFEVLANEPRPSEYRARAGEVFVWTKTTGSGGFGPHKRIAVTIWRGWSGNWRR